MKEVSIENSILIRDRITSRSGLILFGQSLFRADDNFTCEAIPLILNRHYSTWGSFQSLSLIRKCFAGLILLIVLGCKGTFDKILAIFRVDEAVRSPGFVLVFWSANKAKPLCYNYLTHQEYL